MCSKLLPHRVKNLSCLINSEEFVWPSDRMNIGAMSVMKVRVWFPKRFQHFYI